ncbi:MAG: aminotransferase class I/II-fold pyridoxal phosphate-dependent enzyme [Candidatus Kapabacteria bacterium]|nr:aminotransferase class I/II-fold pyridoxal phosphate-dependent enzyme [Candidatus Kapabacteria bacterium]
MIVANPHLMNVASYKPGATPEQIRFQYGLDHVEKLASNENPLGSSPRAMRAALDEMSLAHRYNDGGLALRSRLAEWHNVDASAISVHNGSDAIIHQIMRVFLLPGETALSSHGTFISFDLAVRGAGADPQYVPLTSDYRFDVRALANAVTDQTKVIYIANPNNPTGTHITREELVWFMDTIPGDRLVVLDEAYVEYALHQAPHTFPDALALGYSNLLCLRTFSKAYGLAALRIGYAIGHPDVVQWLISTKLPFDPSGPGCAAAVAALDDQQFVNETTELNAKGLALLLQTLNECGYTTSRSIANFVMIDLEEQEAASALHVHLLHQGFIARLLAGFGLPTCVRISTGTHEQNVRLTEVLRAYAHEAIGAPSQTMIL